MWINYTNYQFVIISTSVIYADALDFSIPVDPDLKHGPDVCAKSSFLAIICRFHPFTCYAGYVSSIQFNTILSLVIFSSVLQNWVSHSEKLNYWIIRFNTSLVFTVNWLSAHRYPSIHFNTIYTFDANWPDQGSNCHHHQPDEDQHSTMCNSTCVRAHHFPDKPI